MDDVEDQADEIIQQFRQLAWAVPISRDHMLKVVEEMPPEVREHVHERAQKSAAQLTAFWAELQDLTASLPTDIPWPESLIERLARLRLSIKGALREVDLLAEDLQCMFGEPADSKTCN